MSTNLILASPSEMAPLHRLVTRLALAGSWVSALGLVAVGGLSGRPRMLVEALGPGVLALVLTIQVMARKEHATFALGVGTAVVVFTHRAVGDGGTRLAAAVAVVAMATLATLFVGRWAPAYVAGTTAALTFVPPFWSGEFEGSMAAGLTMALGFLVGSCSFLMIRNASAAVNTRYRSLFEAAPAGLLELDWARAMDLISERHLPVGAALGRLLAADPDLVGEILASVVVTRVNAAAVALAEAEGPDGLLGPIPPSWAGGQNREPWIRQIVAMTEGGTPFEAEMQMRSVTGRLLWLAVRSIAVTTKRDEMRLLLAVSDITPARQVQENLAGVIEAKDRFIASVGHELRTPLTAVVGLSSELDAATDLGDEERRELMAILGNQARELSYIVDDLLVAARADIGTVAVKSEPVDLRVELQRVIGELAIKVDSTWSPADLPRAAGDPVRLRQILRNLLLNAERYGGTRRRVVLDASEGSLLLEVRDSGAPLSAEDRLRIFEPYGRAHHRPGTTASVGLGLSVSLELARLMGGDLSYDHDGETVFCLRIPQAAGELGRASA